MRFRIAGTNAVPALLAVGDLDIRTPVATAEELATTLPNARVVVVENAAHQFSSAVPNCTRQFRAF